MLFQIRKDGREVANRREDVDGAFLMPNCIASDGQNIHSGGHSPAVDDWSAGCQVVPADAFGAFYTLVATSGQHRFEYWMFDGELLDERRRRIEAEHFDQAG